MMRSQPSGEGGGADGRDLGREATDRRHQEGEVGGVGWLTAQEITRKFGVRQVEQAVEKRCFSA